MVHRAGHRARLYDIIIGGFEYLLKRSSRDSQRQSGAGVDGRGAGYVVWVPRKAQYQQQGGVWDEDSEREGVDETSGPVVAYGGGYGGLFNGGVEQALACCDCFVPPLLLVRIPLELLPPPSSAQSTSSAAGKDVRGCPTATSSSRDAIHCSRSQSTAGTLSSDRLSSPRPIAKETQRPGEGGKQHEIRGVPRERCDGRDGAESSPAVRQRRNEATKTSKVNLGRKKDSPELETGERSVASRTSEKPFRQREIVDLWWLTDPPAPKVSAGALRLRVATEAVQVLQTDAEDAPDVVCTIEVCQGRPYLPGRLQRYPNVGTSSGAYRPVHSYRVPLRSCAGESTFSGGGAGSTRSVLSSVDPAVSSSWHGSGGGGGEGSDAGMAATPEAWVSITDVKPSHWYNVRHRFSWRAGGQSALFASIEEVVTATRHVHTEVFFPLVIPPPRPYAMLGCSRRYPQHQQSKQQLNRDQRPSKPRGGRGGHPGLGFHFRLRWGPGPRGTGRHEDRLIFGPGGAPKEKEYVVQVCVREPSSSKKASHNRGSFDSGSGVNIPPARKARANPPAGNCVGSSGDDVGGSSPDLLSSGTKTLGSGLQARNAFPAASRHNATWSSGGTLGDRIATTTTTSTDAAEKNSDHLFPEDCRADRCSGSASKGCRDQCSSEGGWGEWTTICKTGRHRETVDLPHDTSFSPGRGPGAVPLGLRYRVGARRRDGERTFAFSEVLEVPSALLRRLREIEDTVTAREPLPKAGSASKTTVSDAEYGSSTRRLGQDERDVKGALGRDEAIKFLKAFEMSGEGDSFPTHLAWELQSEFWPQEEAQRARKPVLVEEEVRLKAEAESIQRTLGFPVSTGFIAGVIREVDATAGG